MSQQITIDVVSDVSCPWCVIGIKSLEQALAQLDGALDVTMRFQPFELNPAMPPEGQDVIEHLQKKYGASAEQLAQSSAVLHERGAALGFDFQLEQRTRIYNTFDAHRLLHWAGNVDQPRQKALKLALFEAYFSKGEDPSSHAVLTRVAGEVGFDAAETAALLASDRFTDEVRQAEAFYQRQGINSVPAIIINERHLISGGQPPEVFEQALRQIFTLN
jgi:predicted DsbA family dithiol-disulfide isomerase